MPESISVEIDGLSTPSPKSGRRKTRRFDGLGPRVPRFVRIEGEVNSSARVNSLATRWETRRLDQRPRPIGDISSGEQEPIVSMDSGYERLVARTKRRQYGASVKVRFSMALGLTLGALVSSSVWSGCADSCTELQRLCDLCRDPNQRSACEDVVDSEATDTCQRGVADYTNVCK